MAGTVKVAARLDPEVHERLAAVSAEFGCSVTACVQALVELATAARQDLSTNHPTAEWMEQWALRARAIDVERRRR